MKIGKLGNNMLKIGKNLAIRYWKLANLAITVKNCQKFSDNMFKNGKNLATILKIGRN